MKSSEYWQKRFASLEKRQMNKSAEYFKRLEEQYRKAAAEIERDLSKWYARVAVNNEISMAEAKKLLTDNELEEFKWSVDEYIEKGQTLTYSDQWSKQLENASAKVHISRLEAMKLQVQQSVEALYGGEQSSFDNRMREVFSDSYYRTGYEVQKGTGIGYDLAQLDDRRISKVIDKPWAPDGNNFSDRIWKQKNQLVSELHTQITQAAIRGLTPEQAIKSIKEQFNVSSGQAGRLVMTETAYFHSVGQLDMFKELGVEEYEITAVLDSKTSPICQELDGTHLPLSQFQVGVTAPPFHCWCRTTTVPYFDDEFTEDELRAARDDDGNTYQVPSDMTYEEWQDAFANNGDKEKYLRMSSDRMIKMTSDGIPITKEQYEKLKNYANEKGIILENFKNFDGDIQTAYDIINDADDVMRLYPELKTLKNGLHIRLNRFLSDKDFAVTSGHVINLNANAFRNIDELKKAYEERVKAKWFVNGTDYHSIVKHELGHIYDSIHHFDMVKISKKVTGINQTSELFDYIKNTLSKYASEYIDGREIISEAFASVYGSKIKNNFALQIV